MGMQIVNLIDFQQPRGNKMKSKKTETRGRPKKAVKNKGNRQIMQLCYCDDIGGYSGLFALCKDNTVWQYTIGDTEVGDSWEKKASIPK